MISYLYILTGLSALIASLGVVSTSAFYPVNRLILLIVAYLAGSIMYTLLDFYFIGLVYLIVYVGAIVILFLFVIMMVPVQMDHSTDRVSSSSGEGEGEDEGKGSNSGSGSGSASSSSSISSSSSNRNKRQILYLFTLMVILILILTIDSSLFEASGILSYFHPSWSVSFISLPDAHSLGIMIYLAFPVSLILIGIALWVTLIGIIPLSIL